MGIGRFSALECVGTDELRESIGFVRGRRPEWTHLVHEDVLAAFRQLPRRLAPRQPTADDVNPIAHLILGPDSGR
jgi:hypothetical protein